jgi:hypothetical protein
LVGEDEQSSFRDAELHGRISRRKRITIMTTEEYSKVEEDIKGYFKQSGVYPASVEANDGTVYSLKDYSRYLSNDYCHWFELYISLGRFEGLSELQANKFAKFMMKN